tara:strand:- start:47 stop:1018 length:972 start_codon:yes stop_codon:yes gene_type:complete
VRNNLLIIIFLTFSFAINLELSKQNQPIKNSRIAWGSIVESINEYPFNINLVTYFGSNAIPFCSASLIDEEWLVTAAHCAEAAQENIDWGASIYAFMGTNSIYVYEETFESNEVLEIFIHPEYSVQPLQNDIAVFKIAPVQYNEGIQPVLLSNIRPEHGSFAKVTGYGSTENDSGGGFLREARMIIYDEDTAQPDLFYGTGSEVNGNLPSACPGDSGGPLFILNDMDEFELIGVSSFILSDCVNNSYTGFQDIAYHLDWINSTTEIFISLAGDINGDYVINIQDIVLTVNLVMSGEYNSAADLNSDGVANVLDIVQIVNIILN